MHIVAIGDIHGRTQWKQIVEMEDLATRIVFIGDYFDSWHVNGADQIENFKEILELKRANPEKVILLMGNHDFQYVYPGERYSGYNDAYAAEYREIIGDALRDGLLQMAHEEDGYLFTHAGVTEEWCVINGIMLSKEPVAVRINDLYFKEDPGAFKFNKEDRSGCGEDSRQSPIWVRPDALFPAIIDRYVQVVGHTTQEDGIDISKYDNLILIDAIGAGEYLVISDEGLLVGTV